MIENEKVRAEMFRSNLKFLRVSFWSYCSKQNGQTNR